MENLLPNSEKKIFREIKANVHIYYLLKNFFKLIESECCE